MVFNSCDALVTPVTPPKPFMVDTVISTAERLALYFIGIVYGDPPVDVTVQLRGTFAEFHDPLLPDPAVDTGHGKGISEFILFDDAWLDGQTQNKPKAHCDKPRGDRIPLLNPGSTLVIKASCRVGTPATNCTLP